ncbi:unnamed protein product [Rhizophagus irregularis]|nr:unnamed protein product [Rhizophagus irregularis]CAB4421299.1 unnamed protein product [Rhizophagus irregularis]
MLIKIGTQTGKEFELDIENSDTLEKIKERIEETTGVPPAQQRIIFSGRQLDDKKTNWLFVVEIKRWSEIVRVMVADYFLG